MSPLQGNKDSNFLLNDNCLKIFFVNPTKKSQEK